MNDLESRYFELQDDMLTFIESKVKDELKLFRTWDDLIYIPSEFYFVKGSDFADLCYIGKIIKTDGEIKLVGYNQEGKEVSRFNPKEVSEFSLLLLYKLLEENNYE